MVNSVDTLVSLRAWKSDLEPASQDKFKNDYYQAKTNVSKDSFEIRKDSTCDQSIIEHLVNVVSCFVLAAGPILITVIYSCTFFV